MQFESISAAENFIEHCTKEQPIVRLGFTSPAEFDCSLTFCPLEGQDFTCSSLRTTS